MALKTYYPEMNEEKPASEIEAAIGYGGYWLLKTPLELKGRGITHTGTLTAEQLVPQAQHKAGWHTYRVTRKAFDKLSSEYAISSECLL